MRLTVLGSGNADHHPDRACSSYLLQTPDPLLLDFGPGAWRNLARARVAPEAIGAVLISHLHSDHFSDLIPFLFHQSWSPEARDRAPLTLLGPPGTRKVLESLRATIPHLDEIDFTLRIAEEGTSIGPVTVTPVRVPHVEDLVAVAWRVSDGSRTFVYSGDCRRSDATVEALRNADLAVIEATFPDDHPHKSHMTIGEACEVATTAGVKEVVLGHLSRRWDGRDPVAEAEGRFSGRLHAGEDLMSLEF